MLNQPLSQAEIDSLLAERSSVRGGDTEASGASVRALSERLKRLTALAQVPNPTEPGVSATGVKLLRRVRTLHESLVPRLATVLSGLLRAAVEVRLAAVERDRVGGFLLTHDRATCFMPLQTASHDHGLALEIELAILYPLINRLLGGGMETQSLPDRPPTDIEKRLAERIAEPVLGELQQVWELLQPWRLSVARVASQVSTPEGLTSRSMICTVRFQIAVGPARGDAILVIPWELLERIDEVDWKRLPCNADTNAEGPGTVELAAVLAEVEVPADELQNLQVGDVIPTDRTFDDLAEVSLNGVAAFRGRPGAADGHKAIRLE
jgi:flagellar motor switch protein FliM